MSSPVIRTIEKKPVEPCTEDTVNINHVTFESEGEPVQALLYEPADRQRPHPAVVISPSRLREIGDLDWLARPLAERGYVALCQAYRDGDTRYQLRDVEDVRSALNWLQAWKNVDVSSIGLIGHSRGGSASLQAAALDERVRSTVALNSPIDIARYVSALKAHARSRYDLMVRGYGGGPESDPEFYRAISPITYADRLTTPVLLIHGEADLIAPQEHSTWMRDALIKAGNLRASLQLVPSMGHFFEVGLKGYLFDDIVRRCTDWLVATLRTS
jgi:uncharacterized protein